VCAEACRGAAVALENHEPRGVVWRHELRYGVVPAHAGQQVDEGANADRKKASRCGSSNESKLSGSFHLPG